MLGDPQESHNDPAMLEGVLGLASGQACFWLALSSSANLQPEPVGIRGGILKV